MNITEDPAKREPAGTEDIRTPVMPEAEAHRKMSAEAGAKMSERAGEETGFLSTRRKAMIFVAAVPAAGMVIRLALPYILRAMMFGIPRCLMDVFGLRCPLCGGTRCCVMLARGDIAKAVYYNPYVVGWLLYLLIWYVRVALSCVAKKYRRALPYRDMGRFSWIVLAVTVLFLIVRNLPFYRAVLY